MLSKLTILAIALICLAGCARTSRTPGLALGMRAKNTYNHSAAAQLAEAAVSISHSLVELEKIQQAATPPLHIPTPPEPASYGMGDLASVDWSGPVEPVLKNVAKSGGYHVNILGKAPPMPILITLYAHHKPLGEILRNIGFQCGKKADVIVFPDRRLIELRYAKA